MPFPNYCDRDPHQLTLRYFIIFLCSTFTSPLFPLLHVFSFYSFSLYVWEGAVSLFHCCWIRWSFSHLPCPLTFILINSLTWWCERWLIWGAHCRWPQPCNVARGKPRVRCGRRSTGTRPTAGTGTQLSHKRHKQGCKTSMDTKPGWWFLYSAIYACLPFFPTQKLGQYSRRKMPPVQL